MFALTGKTALVTGGAQGIGKASAQALAHMGANVVLADINEARLQETAAEIRSQGGNVFSVVMNVCSNDSISAAVKAAKLTISSTVPVVGSMIADASETLLVSAGLIRSGVGIFGMLGVLAVSIGPFLETGLGYLTMKCTAALSASVGEKQLSSLISALAGAMGLITALTGVCTVLVLISCVAFMGFTTGG